MTKVGLAAVITGGLAVGIVAAILLRPKQEYLYEGHKIPSGGLILHPRGSNPGDPQNAITRFRKIYAAMTAYRNQNRKLPTISELLDFSHPLGGIQLSESDFNPPDMRYADGYIEGQKNPSSFMFSYIQPRPDGSPKPAFPKRGERDVWLVSTDYVRSNQVVYADRHSKMRFSGEYVVLWSDGKIDEVPVTDSLYRGTGKESTLSFRGETGLPDKVTTLKELRGNDRFNQIAYDR